MATERGYYRAELERSINNIEMALTHLVRVVEAYAKDHPEISKEVASCCDALVLVGETVEKIHDSI